MKALAISYGKNFFTEGNEERARMVACARAAGEMHMVIFTDARDGYKPVTIDGVLHLYPTNSTWGLGKVLDAMLIARKIIKAQPGYGWVVTAQDPFEAGLVGWVVARRSGAPLNIQEHGDFFSTPFWRLESHLNRWRYRLGRRLLRRADTIRVVSERTRETLTRLGVAPERILKLSVETDTEAFCNAQANPALIPDYQSDHTYILSVARFVPQKHLAMLVHAFCTVAKQFPKARLMLVGTGVEESYLKSIAGGSSRIQFLPWSDDVPSLMATSHLYALSSNYEGWGRVLVEAQAAGLPIVTTDVGCVGEAVVASDAVKVVPPYNEALFSRALTDALKTLPDMQAAAQKYTKCNTEKAGEASYAQRWREILETTQHFTV